MTGTAFGNHDLGWIRKQLPADGDPNVRVRDTTSSRACFGIWGPRARDILQPLTTDDLSNEAFPYMTAREITLGDVPVLALRVTYVGELGWELYAPSEYGRALWRSLWEAGREHGLVAAGYRAIDALRLEKGYRVWSSDITPEETPYEAGLGFAVKLDKGVDFIGREALAAAKAAGPRKRLRCLVLDDPRSVCLAQRARARRWADRRARHERRLRLRGRALDRLRLPAARPGGHRDARRGRGVRRVDRLRDRPRAAVGSRTEGGSDRDRRSCPWTEHRAPRCAWPGACSKPRLARSTC